LVKPPAARYHHAADQGASMTRNNILYLVVGALCVVVAVLGYQVYQDRKKPEGVNINLGPGGISIEKK
jgi:predicted negative regulator of RcsB-dependent stress response